MNIFSSLTNYAGKWQQIASRDFEKEEIEAVEKAEVVSSQYGRSVCFHMKAGGQTYIPLSNYCSLKIGDTVDISEAKLITLHRDGSDDIIRVDA